MLYERTSVNMHRLGSSAMVHLDGPIDGIGSAVQLFAWLTAAIRKPAQNSLTVSTAVVRMDGNLIQIVPKTMPLAPTGLTGAQEETHPCWHQLMHGTVLAYGFPISREEQAVGLGLEIPFDLMLAMARVTTRMHLRDDALLLAGPKLALFPSESVLDKTAMRWHCLQVKEDGQIPKLPQDPSMAIVDVKTIREYRTFLGYYPRAVINLGTKSFIRRTEPIPSSGLKSSRERIQFSKEGAASLGISASFGFPARGNVTANISGKWEMSRTLLVTAERGYRDLVESAKVTPVMIYDVFRKTAWMVSELSVALHIALTTISRRDSNVRSLPYAQPEADSGNEALRICIDPPDAVLWNEKDNPITFSDVMEGILRDFGEFKKAAKIRKQACGWRPWPLPIHGLMGWEFEELVIREAVFSERELQPGSGHKRNSWWQLPDEMDDTVVIFGKEFGNVIQPKAEDPGPFGTAGIPESSNLLVASKFPIHKFMNGNDDKNQIYIGSLQWTKASRPCTTCRAAGSPQSGKRPCLCVQHLQSKGWVAPWTGTRAPPDSEVLAAEAVVFGMVNHFRCPMDGRH